MSNVKRSYHDENQTSRAVDKSKNASRILNIFVSKILFERLQRKVTLYNRIKMFERPRQSEVEEREFLSHPEGHDECSRF